MPEVEDPKIATIEVTFVQPRATVVASDAIVFDGMIEPFQNFILRIGPINAQKKVLVSNAPSN
jgi:hypothetical protein